MIVSNDLNDRSHIYLFANGEPYFAICYLNCVCGWVWGEGEGGWRGVCQTISHLTVCRPAYQYLLLASEDHPRCTIINSSNSAQQVYRK